MSPGLVHMDWRFAGINSMVTLGRHARGLNCQSFRPLRAIWRQSFPFEWLLVATRSGRRIAPGTGTSTAN